MRARFLGTLILAPLALGGCGEEAPSDEVIVNAEPVEEVALEAPPGVVVDAQPAHGGVVVPAGPHPVEVVARPGGGVEAYFVGDEPPPAQDVQLTVRVPTASGPRPVVLIWDPSQERYRGTLSGATYDDGPVEVEVHVGSNAYRGRSPTLVVVAPSRPRGPDVDVVVDEAPRARGAVVVERPAPPRAEVRVQAPRPRAQVVVHGPAPPPGPRVVVHGPAPPSPRVVVHGPAPPGPGRVVVHGPAPPPPGHVVVRGGPPGHRRGHGRGHRGHGRGHGRGHRGH